MGKTTALDIPRNFEPTTTGLVIHGEPTLDEWKAAGEAFAFADKMLHWMIGDWINYGGEAWGTKYADAIELTGLPYGTLRIDAHCLTSPSKTTGP